jgi:hypothetical protein
VNTVTVQRRIDLTAFPFPVSARWDGTDCQVTADVPTGELQAAVDAAPDWQPQPTTEDRVDTLEPTVDRLWERAGDPPTEQEQTVERTIADRLATDLVAVQAILDTTNQTINQNPAAHIKTLARVVRRLSKHAIRLYDTAD